VATPSRFAPGPGEPLALFGEAFHVRLHPGAEGMPHSSEGSRAIVYGLTRQQDGRPFAIKLLRRKYRGPHLVASSQDLRPLHDLPGLAAADRLVVLESEPAALRCPDLSYSLLIPWLAGNTWFDLLNEARAGSWKLDRGVAIELCHRFLAIMAGLEARGMAHTDVSPGNVMIDRTTQGIELLDLEDMYLPGAARPIDPSAGSPGYRHVSMTNGANLWHAAGDRYAAAVLAAEILVLAEPKLCRLATEQGFFIGHHGTEVGRLRYGLAESWLHLVAPTFLEDFRRSWHESKLESCPALARLREALVLAKPEIPGFAGWIAWDDTRHVPGPAPAAHLAAPAPRVHSPEVVGPAVGLLIGVAIGISLALAVGGPAWAWLMLSSSLGGLCGLLEGMRLSRKASQASRRTP